ncbi:PTS sugar transporter subunit IIB [Salmonella enterica subsp. enterica]|nr:PTS sugar transporter subunit IIB [Salmonella enterica subsp. enterica]
MRIDYRLLHGQWLSPDPALDIDHIIVVNANAAGDAFVSMSLVWQNPLACRWTLSRWNRRRKTRQRQADRRAMVVLGNTAETLASSRKCRGISAHGGISKRGRTASPQPLFSHRSRRLPIAASSQADRLEMRRVPPFRRIA